MKLMTCDIIIIWKMRDMWEEDSLYLPDVQILSLTADQH